MTAACLLIAVFEFLSAAAIVFRYSKDGDMEVFMTFAPLDAIIRVSHHMRMALTMFQFATILSVLRTQ